MRESYVTNLIHDDSKSPEYRCWAAVKNRCSSPTSKDFRKYGAKGITLCAEWNRYERFLSDMGRKPSPAHSIDRIDSNGPYAPWNCRWATTVEQNRNRSNSVHLTAFGVSRLLMEWAEDFDIRPARLRARISKGIAPEAALTTPVRKWRRNVS